MRVKTSRENKKIKIKIRVGIQNRKYEIEKLYRSRNTQRYEVNPNRNQTSIKREKIKADKEYRVKT